MKKASFQLKTFLALLTLLVVVSFASAKTVRLITIGPGDAFWSAFGHSAIAIDEDVYGFGYFSFADDVVSEFIHNRMQYEIGVSNFNYELLSSEQQNRSFSFMELSLSESEISALEEYLQWHLLPENQAYHYDYFLNNCATKIRDLLNQSWQDQLLNSSQTQTESSYFQQTFPAKHQGLMNLGLALSYGWPAYTQRNAWELMALPVFMESHVSSVMVSKVTDINQLYIPESPQPLVSFISTHWTLITYVILWSLLLLVRRTRNFTAKSWFVWHGLIGLILLGIWLFTPHAVIDGNFNVLLFVPLGWLLMRTKYFKGVFLFSWSSWFAIAFYLNAWYLMPMLIPNLLALYAVSKLQSLSKN